MTAVSPAIQRLAAELVALEAASPPGPGGAISPCVRICENLRASLITLIGLSGYRALLSRALALASEENPSLRSARVGEDGSLEGLDAVTPSGDAAPNGAIVVTHVLGLLATFIGEPLTFRLVQNAWPQAPRSAPERPETGSQS